MFELKGKVALVTGAAAGIGFAYVKELLKNELKAVAMVDVDDVSGQAALEEVVKEFGKERAIFIKTDVSNHSQLEHAFQTTVDTFKQLDILINNAGILNEFQWEKCIAVNLGAVIHGSKLAVEKYFPKYKSGSEAVILNTASAAGLYNPEGFLTYSATKSGVIGFTRSMGQVYFENTKVRTIAVCPTFTKTAMFNFDKNHIPEPYLSMIIAHRDTLSAQSPEDVAKQAIHLINDAPAGSVWLIMDGECKSIDCLPTKT